ncbi:Phosphoglycerate mutase [Sulfitobacter noctilucicola]|uniref:Broad specificity phosphatase PhoE n=1 Tax=Sulfitobacter noctilucicola TaxID=1342301 RepID=A0A7W6Q6V1_9RHOB|nr:histidine phosphatase family protein [Sulfitobacter noctilucicola]KIN63258.1 Phosphoglycerate mutase [Sulfitobacter noctilucicola]MBB4175222.1 broad specificity phosphatase PhoE [Sulfitobacter noctilucicola]
MTVWHWVRHGPTHEKNFVGWRDVPADLSDKEQISRLRAHLPAQAKIISSDLIRCVTTADVVMGADHHRLPHDPGLREIDFGIWDGMHFKDVADRDPELSRAFWEKPGDIAAPDGESWNQTAARVNRVIDALNEEHADAHIIAVAHFGVILTQVQRAMAVGAYQAMSHKIDNFSVTTLSHDNGKWQVHGINHLP